MCCFVLVLGFLGPRFAFLWVWLATARVELAFGGNFWVPLLGILFLPWTALAYVLVWAPGAGVSAVGWMIVALGFVIDLASYFGRTAQQRYEGAAA